MYSEWASLSSVIAEKSNGSANTVLNKFSNVAGRDVSQAVAKQLASNLGITQSPEPSILITDDEVSVPVVGAVERPLVCVYPIRTHSPLCSPSVMSTYSWLAF